jgi:hypothetical protein
MRAPCTDLRLSRIGAFLALAALLSVPAEASEVFSKPPTPGGGVNSSSWVDPDGTDYDTYSWDEFTLAETQVITEVRWRGGYALNAPYGHAHDFRISFFDSNVTGFEPLITALPEKESQETVIATFHTYDAAGETFAGVSGGVVMYDYHYTLPTPVTIPGGVKCWFRVVAAQPVYPDWGMATGTGGNGSHFYFNTGTSMFQNWPHDLSFSLHAEWANLGNALPGTQGTPQLTASGSLKTGSQLSIKLTDARPNALVLAVVGITQVNLPFYGGTMVPAFQLPYGVILNMATNASGQIPITYDWPGSLPSGTEIIIQHWIADPAALYGAAASNAVMSVVP